VAHKGQGREAVEHLAAAVEAFVAGKYGKAERAAAAAKQLAPRSSIVREVLGLSAYRMGRWEEALRELRTYRRLTGETFNLPVEMDVLRALERPGDVEKAWGLLRRLGGTRATMDEGRVVFGSYLLDRDEARRAWDVVDPGRLGREPKEHELRVWYVAARAAVRLGDRATARKLYEAIQDSDPAFPGLDELDAAISG
jgi:tetratricopeptide (TPR) repeat protein